MSDVLFICTGNFYRSRFAEAVFNHHAARRGILARAISRGLMPYLAEGNISPYTQAALATRLISLAHTSPKPTVLTVEDLSRTTHAIALHGEEHRPMVAKQYPEWANRIRYWDISDLPLDPHIALPLIELNVLEFLDTFPAQPGSIAGGGQCPKSAIPS